MPASHSSHGHGVHWPSSIGVLIRCHQHSGFAVRLIRLVRPYVDEIVVAADEQMSSAAIGALAAEEPTTLVRVPHVFPNERATMYLHNLCRSGWALRIAGDEVPSLDLLRNLRQLVSDERMTHYRVPVRWMWPDARRALDEAPWRFDFHVRLFRNDDAVRHYASVTHGSFAVAGNYRYLEAPIYHLVFLVTSESARRKKAERYATERPELRYKGQPFNEAWYLPEARKSQLCLADVPDEDANTIAEVLGTSLEAEATPVDVPLVSLDQIDAHWSSKPWSDDDYRVAITPAHHDLDFDKFGHATLFVWLTNNGSETLPSAIATAPLVRLAYRWLDDSGGCVVHDGLRTPLPSPLAPGERMLMPMQIESPGAGECILELDLVHEAVRWFGINHRLAVTIA